MLNVNCDESKYNVISAAEKTGTNRLPYKINHYRWAVATTLETFVNLLRYMLR